MADYYNRTVVTPAIPIELMTPLEAWILKNTFEFHEDKGDRSIYFFTQECMNSFFETEDPEFILILRSDASPLAEKMATEFAEAGSPADWDLGSTSYVDVFQVIIKRSAGRLPYVCLETAQTCSSMRLDGFGGTAEIITEAQAQFVNTGRWLHEMITLVESGLPLQPIPSGELM